MRRYLNSINRSTEFGLYLTFTLDFDLYISFILFVIFIVFWIIYVHIVIYMYVNKLLNLISFQSMGFTLIARGNAADSDWSYRLGRLVLHYQIN